MRMEYEPNEPLIESKSLQRWREAGKPRGGLSAYAGLSIERLLELDKRGETEGVTARLPTDSAARKNMPIATGVIDYFPDALAAIAEVSKKGNDKHNPGEPLHWAREKSTDHADCIARHLIERGRLDEDGGRHSAKLAWRALALLQEEIEEERKATSR